MGHRKKQSIAALVGAMAEAEAKKYNKDGTDLKALQDLLKGKLLSDV